MMRAIRLNNPTQDQNSKEKLDIKILKSHQQNVSKLKERLNTFFNGTTDIDYIDEAREIAFSIQELEYKNKSLIGTYSKAFPTEQEYFLFCNKLEAFKVEYRLVENALQCLVNA